jgi:hypothetical protein
MPGSRPWGWKGCSVISPWPAPCPGQPWLWLRSSRLLPSGIYDSLSQGWLPHSRNEPGPAESRGHSPRSFPSWIYQVTKGLGRGGGRPGGPGLQAKLAIDSYGSSYSLGPFWASVAPPGRERFGSVTVKSFCAHLLLCGAGDRNISNVQD